MLKAMSPSEMNEAGPPTWPLGPLAERILQVIWQRGPSTVRQVREALTPDHTAAYTTVMTVMTRLADRGLLRRAATGGSYTYSAAYSEGEYGALVAQRLARDLVARFGDLALAQFAAELGRVDPERLRRLRGLAGEDEGA